MGDGIFAPVQRSPGCPHYRHLSRTYHYQHGDDCHLLLGTRHTTAAFRRSGRTRRIDSLDHGWACTLDYQPCDVLARENGSRDGGRRGLHGTGLRIGQWQSRHRFLQSACRHAAPCTRRMGAQRCRGTAVWHLPSLRGGDHLGCSAVCSVDRGGSRPDLTGTSL